MLRAKMQNSQLMEVLQQAVNTELSVSQHYWGRAAYWRGVGAGRLTTMYEGEANEERGHAQLVADRMIFLGQQPELRPQTEIPTQETLKQQFTKDLAGEVLVANTYVGWIQQALDLEDFTTQRILERILKETEEHINFIQGELLKMDLIGEENYLQTWMMK